MKKSAFLTAAIFATITSSNSAAQSADPTTHLQTCELHVSGAGWPSRVPTLASFRELKEREARDPLSPFNVYGTVYRAHNLDDKLLKRLLPNSVNITIVRHIEMHDLDKTPLSGVHSALYSSTSECYADLVIEKIYGVFPNAGRNPYGLVGVLLAGNSRLVTDFWLQVRKSDGAGFVIYKGKFESPLHVATTDSSSEDAALAVNSSSNDNLRKFVDQVIDRHAK